MCIRDSHVLDQTGEVFKIDITTGTKTLFVTLQDGLDNLVFDASGTMYVSNADHGWITEVQPGGQTKIISKGGMISPMGLAVLPGTNNQDALFVADLFRLRAVSYTHLKSGNLWIGTDFEGVSKYDGKTFTHFSIKEGLSHGIVYCIAEDKSGNLWFGTTGCGVTKYCLLYTSRCV